MSETKITKIGYSQVFNLGDYENEKISVEAEIQEGDDPIQKIEELRVLTINAHELRGQVETYKSAKISLASRKQASLFDQEVVDKMEEKFPFLKDKFKTEDQKKSIE